MNKNIIKVFDRYNFIYEKNNGYGEINGYEVNIVNPLYSVGPTIAISTYLTMVDKNMFVTKLMNHKYSLVTAKIWDYGVIITIGSMTSGGFVKKAPEIINTILQILTELGAKNKDYCPLTGEELSTSNPKQVILKDSENFKITLSEAAVQKVNDIVDTANKQFDNRNPQYGKGFIGIFIGALAGGALSFILFQIGFVSAFSSILSIILGISLYTHSLPLHAIF